ncbi:hypothetical protein V8E36_009443 [Tilletia maclaganii]
MQQAPAQPCDIALAGHREGRMGLDVRLSLHTERTRQTMRMWANKDDKRAAPAERQREKKMRHIIHLDPDKHRLKLRIRRDCAEELPPFERVALAPLPQHDAPRAFPLLPLLLLRPVPILRRTLTTARRRVRTYQAEWIKLSASVFREGNRGRLKLLPGFSPCILPQQPPKNAGCVWGGVKVCTRREARGCGWVTLTASSAESTTSTASSAGIRIDHVCGQNVPQDPQ